MYANYSTVLMYLIVGCGAVVYLFLHPSITERLLHGHGIGLTVHGTDP